MKLKKERNIIILEEKNKQVEILYAGNFDLYFMFYSKINSNDHSFIITKENYGIYSLFNDLFYDIENINLYDGIEDYQKEKYRNSIAYKELYNKNTITWYSDETAHEVANYLKIKKEKEEFKLEFFTQPYINGYDKDFNSSKYIPIRFRNSGSSYNPFNLIFMKLYNNIKHIDDINDYGHQIHIEEYNYEKNLVKKR